MFEERNYWAWRFWDQDRVIHAIICERDRYREQCGLLERQVNQLEVDKVMQSVEIQLKSGEIEDFKQALKRKNMSCDNVRTFLKEEQTKVRKLKRRLEDMTEEAKKQKKQARENAEVAHQTQSKNL